MIRAKKFEALSKFVKVMARILWPLFSRTRCIRCMRIFRGFVLAGSSNDSVVVDDGNFWRFRRLLRKFQR